MKRQRRIIIYAACLVLTLSLLLAGPIAGRAAYAAEASPEFIAASLKELGLFIGTNNGFDLDKPCDRLMGAVILTRLLGKEKEAQNSGFGHPFTDIADSYAEPYIGYLYKWGLTKGVSDSVYGRDSMSGQQFATLILRALDYVDGVDFQWDNALGALADLGIISLAEARALAEGSFLRAQAVLLCHRALTAAPKGAELPLIRKMLWDDVFDTRQLAHSKDASLLLAADMPDHMIFAVTTYTEQEFRDIFWLSLRNRQANFSVYAPYLNLDQAISIINGLFAPYFGRAFFVVSIKRGSGGLFDISTYISEYMTMQFYYENPQRYQKNLQFYEERFRQPIDDYISMFLWRDKLESIINSLIKPGMSEYERVKAIHDYVALTIEYDYNEKSKSHLAEGALFYNLALCDGYSAAIKMLLNATGIECLLISGDSIEGPHAWNQVKIDGEWYNLDVTWAKSLGKGAVYYGYFCQPDTVFLRDHMPEKSGVAQSCTSTAYQQQ